MRPRAADLDSVPVGVPQMMGAPESLHVWLENQEMVTIGHIYSGSRVCKRKINFRCLVLKSAVGR